MTTAAEVKDHCLYSIIEASEKGQSARNLQRATNGHHVPTAHVNVTAYAKWVRLSALDEDSENLGSTKAKPCTSLTIRWILGSNKELVVNSPARRKAKKPRQHAAKCKTWAWEFKRKERRMTLKRLIVI